MRSGPVRVLNRMKDIAMVNTGVIARITWCSCTGSSSRRSFLYVLKGTYRYGDKMQ